MPTTKNSDELWACHEKVYVAVTYSVQTNTQQIRTPRNLDMKKCQVLKQNIGKTAWKPKCSSENSRNGEKIFSRPTSENHGNGWLTSTKPQVWTEEKTLWECVLVVTAVKDSLS